MTEREKDIIDAAGQIYVYESLAGARHPKLAATDQLTQTLMDAMRAYYRDQPGTEPDWLGCSDGVPLVQDAATEAEYEAGR